MFCNIKINCKPAIQLVILLSSITSKVFLQTKSSLVISQIGKKRTIIGAFLTLF